MFSCSCSAQEGAERGCKLKIGRVGRVFCCGSREQNQTLVMVTHDNHLAAYADRIFHIIDGKIVKIEENRQMGKEDGKIEEI